MVRRRLERERFWRGMMREQRTGGLSVSAFCRERGVSVTSFYKWRRKFQQQTTEQPTSNEVSEEQATRDDARKNLAAASNDPKFVPIELLSPFAAKDSGNNPTTGKATNSQRANCEVVLPDGCRIFVSERCDPSWLREILGVLEERAC